MGDDDEILLIYELFAAAGGSRCLPVSPKHAALIAKHVRPEELAVAERLYRAMERAASESPPDGDLESVLARAREILAQPN